MNIYSFIPLIATIIYIPLIISTASNRPWQTKHRLFVTFVIVAMIWSLTDYIFRNNFLPQYHLLFLKAIIILFTAMAVQFYCFISSFFAQRQGRWLLFAYFTLALVVVLVATGQLPEGITTEGNKIYPEYGKSIIYMAVPLLILLARTFLALWYRLKIQENPVIRNQLITLLFSLVVLTVFTTVAILPWGREFPISHIGNLINALLLSYATIRHQLVDIRLVLRRGLGWTILGIIGVLSYWLIYLALHFVLGFKLDGTEIFAAILSSIAVATFIYRLRSSLFIAMGKALGGSSYEYRKKLSDFTREIHKVFSLKKQGGELLALVSKSIGCKKACLLFADESNNGFSVQICEPKGKSNMLSSLVLRGDNPIVDFLKREQKPLTRDDIAVLPEFRSLWKQEKEQIDTEDLEVFLPLISRGKLIGILMLDKKKYGRYSLEDFTLLEEVTSRVAVSMEKEYLSELLREREEELSVINRSSAIITSSLDIQRIYDSFIKELKKIVEVSWAAIVLLEENELYFLALSSEIGSAWKVGERIPANDTAVQYAASTRKPVIESDLSQDNKLTMKRYLFDHGIRSVVYLPLIANNNVIGSLIIASRHSNAYSNRDVKLLEELSLLIAMPIENSRLYAVAEHKARSDSLTGLLNRRSLDEMIASEIGRHSRYGGTFSLMLLDLDTFKAYNDSYGHLAGDEFLRKVSTIMKTSIRGSDQAFRYGGDEFALLLPQTDIVDAIKVAERIRNRIGKTAEADQIPSTASLGLASWPADGIGVTEIIAAADSALLQAKRNGGNSIHLYSQGQSPRDNQPPVKENNEDSRVLSTIYSLAATVDARDHYTCSHSKKVNEYAVALAEALQLEPLEISRLSTCAFLHDIGKIGISDEILNKPGKLDAAEWGVIKGHPQMGAAIASHTRQLAPCIDGIRHHHERYDGSGYPKGLRGEEIPLEARILAIADAFAAMTSERRYSAPLSREQAMNEVRRGAGTQFDPRLTEIFLKIMETEPIGTASENKRR